MWASSPRTTMLPPWEPLTWWPRSDMDSVANVHSPHFVDGELSEGLPSLTRIILKELDEKTISS